MVLELVELVAPVVLELVPVVLGLVELVPAVLELVELVPAVLAPVVLQLHHWRGTLGVQLWVEVFGFYRRGYHAGILCLRVLGWNLSYRCWVGLSFLGVCLWHL